MKDFLRENGLLLCIVALLLAAISTVLSFTSDGIASPLSNVVGILTTPFRNGISALVSKGEDLYNYTFSYEELLAENEALQRTIAELEDQAREGESASKENERLRELLGLQARRRDFVFESAQVTAKSSTNWASTLTLSKGSAQDVSVGDCVVDAAGNLVGVISELGLNWSTMVTIIDSSIEIGGTLTRTDSFALIEGDFALMQEGKLKLTYLPEETALLTGDIVLTSGKGGVYPSGLVVGVIDSIHTDVTGMNQYAILEPATQVDELVQVFIIKDYEIVE